MLKLQTIDSIRLLFNKKGFILLTKEYTNSKQKLEYVCPNGHTHSIRLDHFRNGVGCPYCKNTFKKSIDFIKPFFEKEGYILQSNLYFNAFTKLKCVCPKGHRFTCSWHSWQRGNRCPVCADRRWLEKELCFEFNFDFFDKLPPVCWYIKSKKRVKLKTGFRIWDCGNIIYKKLNNNEVNNGY